VEDRISRGLQHCHETCCEKGGLVWFTEVVSPWGRYSGQVDLHMTQNKNRSEYIGLYNRIEKNYEIYNKKMLINRKSK